MKKTFWFWMYFVLAVIMAVYFATRIIMTSLGHGAASRVKTISISADYNSKKLVSLAAVAGIAPGTDVYSLDLDQINSRISSVPDVKESAVRRLPNGNLAIRVKLHRAVAIWTDGQNFFPLSSDGTVVKRQLEQKPSRTVVFRGVLPNDINDIVKSLHTMADNIEFVEWVENRRWNIHTTGGITVMLPQEDSCAAIGKLMVLNKKDKILNKNIQILDLRDPARILVKQ